ncbi:MAG: hypothetical protein M3405_10195 [Acidobacteriota bacterium]|jgi:hypothetical protein|nr:hypothetical protein [Acidobacteriota bacterium]
MNWLKDIITNPFAIATAVVQWCVFIYSIIFERSGFLSNKPLSFDRGTPVFDWLFILNFFPLFIIDKLAGIFNFLTGTNLLLSFLFEILLGIILMLLVTFQWMIVGYFVSWIFNLFNSNKTNLKIN